MYNYSSFFFSRIFPAFFLLVILCFGARHAAARSAEEIEMHFNNANQSYSKGEFADAIASYQQLLEQDGYSAPVLFNLANSYAQSQQPGKAILNYERAFLLNPGDADIAGNLEKVRKEYGLFTAEKSRIDKIFHLLTLQEFSFLLLSGLIVAAALVWICIKFPLRKGTVGLAVLLSTIMICYSLAGIYRHMQEINPAIIIASSAKILISPFENAASLGSIQEGKKVFPLKQHDDYTLVVEETGRKGWVANSFIENILP